MRGLAFGEGLLVQTLQYPFMAGVVPLELRPRFPRAWPVTHTFGATLIHPQWLLSSAHGSRQRAIRLNTPALRAAGGITLDVEEVFCHVDYDDLTQENDIALLKLKAPGAIGVTPVSFAVDSSWRQDGGALFSLGWGRDGQNGFDGRLRERTVALFDQAVCKAKFAESQDVVTDRDFCTASDEAAAGDGDSGGPILLAQSGGWPADPSGGDQRKLPHQRFAGQMCRRRPVRLVDRGGHERQHDRLETGAIRDLQPAPAGRVEDSEGKRQVRDRSRRDTAGSGPRVARLSGLATPAARRAPVPARPAGRTRAGPARFRRGRGGNCRPAPCRPRLRRSRGGAGRRRGRTLCVRGAGRGCRRRGGLRPAASRESRSQSLPMPTWSTPTVWATCTKWSSRSSRVPEARTKALTAVMPITPRRAARARRTRSDLLRGWAASALQLAWVISTGRSELVDRLEGGALGAVREVDRDADLVHRSDHLAAEGGEADVLGVAAARAEPGAGVVGELRNPLAEAVEESSTSATLRKWSEFWKPIRMPMRCSRRARSRSAAARTGRKKLRLAVDQGVPVAHPAQGGAVGIGSVGLDRRVENRHAGVDQALEVGGPETGGLALPGVEPRPVEGEQAEHVDDRRAFDDLGGAFVQGGPG